MTDVLDLPVAESLRDRHAHLARHRGRVSGYRPEVASFLTLPLDPTPDDWADLAALVGPGEVADLYSLPVVAPAGWEPVFHLPGLQLVAGPLAALGAGPEVVELGAADVPEMLELAARTRPGPFWAETPSMGRYVGVRDAGVLVAMAGERLSPPGWTEVSAVCTAPEARGRGLAARLVTAVADGIRARGDGVFLHVVSANTTALGVYERLGFTVRREVVFHGYRVPTA